MTPASPQESTNDGSDRLCLLIIRRSTGAGAFACFLQTGHRRASQLHLDHWYTLGCVCTMEAAMVREQHHDGSAQGRGVFTA